MTVVVLVVGAVVVVAVYLTWLAGRHDRLTARADGAWAALEVQLVRRAAAGRVLAAERRDLGVLAAADSALRAEPAFREDSENALGRSLRQAGYEALPPQGLPPAQQASLAELRGIAGRVRLARQFHNDAVRDLLALRRRPAARLLRLGRGSGQRYFEIDDSVLTGESVPPPAGA